MNSREIIAEILGNTNLIFNKDFDVNFEALKDDMKSSMFLWCRKVNTGEVPHIPIASKKYIGWVLFIDKIADKRILLAKIKNGNFLELHLSSHKYYDEQRKRFGIKKGSKYY